MLALLQYMGGNIVLLQKNKHIKNIVNAKNPVFKTGFFAFCVLCSAIYQFLLAIPIPLKTVEINTFIRSCF